MTPTILATGRYGREFFTVPSQPSGHLVCMQRHRPHMSLLTPLRCAGISSLVAAVPILQLEFGRSRNVALLPVTLYTVGFSFGPCIASPLSELYGRRWIYWTNLPMLIIFNAIGAASNNFVVLIVFRFLAGLGGSGVLAVAAGSLSDIWDTKDAGRVGVPYILAPFLGPSLGPLIGAYVLHQHGNDWKWSIWVVLCFLAPVALTLPLMKETSKRRILYLRHKKLGIGSVDMTASSRFKTLQTGLLRPFHMALFEVRCHPPVYYECNSSPIVISHLHFSLLFTRLTISP
jgi:MFS family permease